MIIKQFDRDILNWQTFWDQYYSSVHVKTNISETDKFTYLKSLLSESAFETISGLTLTSGNYVEAIKLLQNRYGNHQALINAYMDKFVQLEAITKSSDITRLRKVYNQIETGIRNLKTFDVHPESYGSLLVPVLSTKLPGDVRTLFARTFNHGKWDLTEMMEIFKKKFEAKECAFATINYKSRDKNNSQFTSSALFNNSEKNLCIFCGGTHTSSKFRKVSNPKARKDILFKNKVCFTCFLQGHFSSRCTSPYRCTKCEGRHHISICLKDTMDQPSQKSSNHSFSNSSSHSAQNLPSHYTQIASDQASRNSSTHVPHHSSTSLSQTSSNQHNSQSTHTNFTNNLNQVLLQTAYASISDTDLKNSQKLFILFDSGAQRSYITEILKSQLNLQVIRTERIVIKVFGNTDAELKNVDVVI